ncbi:MAG: N-acetylneuraminate synthase family protein [Cyclobacteriaceae bacterium]|nr:N-acetylneuraminate synthase family protein [Cyclobacteriaceae bacterium]
MKDTFIIAEIAQAHDGSLGIVHSYIDAVKESGADSIKFQTHIAEAESSIHEPFRVKFSRQDATRFDYWKRMEFSPEQWVEIKKHCEDAGLEFISSPFSLQAVELLESLQVKRYKIGSGEVSNLLMLEKIARTRKPVMVSSGMSDWKELDVAINFLKERKIAVSVFQCNTQYPTPAEHVGLNMIPALRERYQIPVGLSDHSGEIFPALAAVTMGAEMIEVHTVFDKRMFGPDATSSLTLEQLKEMVRGVRFISKSLQASYQKDDVSRFAEVKKIFGKSLSVNRDLRKGTPIEFEFLESKKPAGYGIPAGEFTRIIGRTLTRDLKKWDFLNEKDLA